MLFKTCKECQQFKNIEEFYKSPAYLDGYTIKCKECTRAYDQEMINRIRQRQIPLKKKCCRCKQEKDSGQFHKRLRNADGLRSECIECTRLQEKDYRTRKPEQGFLCKIKQKYGLSLEDYNLLLAESEGKCSICKEEVKLVVDHSHATGKVRGLLCQNCNAGLGMFGDKTGLLKEAIKYLEKSNDEVCPFACA